MDNHVVIMAGGIGSRLWPASTPETPKQFIDVLGVGKTLIQLTVERFLPLCDISKFWVVTSEKYVGTVMEQLPGIPEDNIIAEPEPRNTAPCIALACRKIHKRVPQANIVVTPADALVLETDRFRKLISEALAFTAGNDSIVTVGVIPSRPETGYGYINAGNAAPEKVCKVDAFKEKPDIETARKYLADGGYFWNAGIFVWTAETIEKQLMRYAPQIAGVMDGIEPYLYTDREKETLARLFPTCDKISIDYAVMEKSDDIYVITNAYNTLAESERDNKPSINQVFIYYVEKTNGSVTDLPSYIQNDLSDLLDDVISQYQNEDFQKFLLYSLIIKPAIKTNNLAEFNMDNYLKYLQNQASSYKTDYQYNDWYDGSVTWVWER